MNKDVICNPYLPSYEYVPDGEPHVFGDRLYIFGSHDRFDGKEYCENDYVCWSAPTQNLKQWRYEGIIYKRSQILRVRESKVICMHLMWRRDRMADTICTTDWIL